MAIPDVDVSAIPAETNFSMTAGDFLESYTAEASWDGIVSCFFLDCAANIIGFIEVFGCLHGWEDSVLMCVKATYGLSD